MDFRTFLLEAEEGTLASKIKSFAADNDIIADTKIYTLASKNESETIGYFIYSKENESDTYYLAKFIDGEKFEALLDDIKETFTTIADTELHIKNKLKGKEYKR